ncbi:MAG: phospholipase D-like domain-containing protein [Myxococcales bacterium]
MRARPVRRHRIRDRARSTGNRVSLLHDGEQALPAMLQAIRAAEYEILLEMYWFDSDRTGREFAEALMERSRAGVCVRVIYDAVGSIEADAEMFDLMRTAGCEIFEFNPIAPWRQRFSFGRLNQRDHRKLLVVDGRVAITGGFNIADHWAPKHAGGGGFRDDGIQLVGAAAGELRDLFYRTFPKPALPLPAMSPELGDTEVTVLANDLLAERRGIYDGYVNAIAKATRYIIICNSYFIPSSRVRKALARAVMRGVRVRVLVPRDTDVKVAQLASRHLYGRLLSSGVEVNEWRGGVLHSKTAVIDDSWCTVGSFNFDARSIHNNLELNVAMESPPVATALRTRVEMDLADSVAIDLDKWSKRSFVIRLIERFFFSLRWLL